MFYVSICIIYIFMHVYYMNVCVGTYAWVNMCVYGYLCMHVYYMDVCVGTYIWINMCVYGYLYFIMCI